MDDSGQARAAAAAPMDVGAAAFAFVLQLLGLPADPAEILHQSGKPALDEADLLRAAKRYPLKARAIASNIERLEATPLPALALLKDGGWLGVGKAAEGKGLGQNPLAGQPEGPARQDFSRACAGVAA